MYLGRLLLPHVQLLLLQLLLVQLLLPQLHLPQLLLVQLILNMVGLWILEVQLRLDMRLQCLFLQRELLLERVVAGPLQMTWTMIDLEQSRRCRCRRWSNVRVCEKTRPQPMESSR
jgi:hypothetical protein